LKANNGMTKTIWQNMLAEQGAIFDELGVQHFGDATSELLSTAKENTICDLSHLGLISLIGSDALTFLQGQVTNDVHQLNGKHAHYSAYCSPKGRMLALFLAFSHDEKIYLQFNQSIVAPIMQRLKMYVMRSKVVINDISDELVRFGINGPDATAILSTIVVNLPNEAYETVTSEQGLIIKLPSIEGHSRYECLIKPTQAIDVWNTLKASCKRVGKPCWNWLDIQMGIPDVQEKTQDQFVPQMLNLDVLKGINFKKGCYTGQEIVARTHYLGKVKRRMYMASIPTNEIPNEGDAVVDAASSEVGQIVKVAPNLTGGFDALVEIRIEAKKIGNITWKTYPVIFGALPYPLDDAAPLDDATK
jgi:tRNA-modifying protein YgfZ